MSKNTEVLAPSATLLTQSVSDESWWSGLPVFLSKKAGTGYGKDHSTMKLEKVNLNKNSLFDLARNNYRACFAAVYAKPEEGGEKAWKVPQDVFDRIKNAIETFVSLQLARLNSGKWEVLAYNRGFAWSNKHSVYTEKAAVTSEMLITIDRQHTAAVIDLGVAKRKLSDLEKQNIGTDDIRIQNAAKRVTNIENRLAGIEANPEYQNMVRLGTASVEKE